MTGEHHTDHIENEQRVSRSRWLSGPALLYFLFYSQVDFIFNGIRKCFGISPPHIFLIQFYCNRTFRHIWFCPTANLSVAVWVGFIALFGIATDDGVVISTYLMQSFKKHKPENKAEVRKAVLEAGIKRVRPCLMTTATTLLALLPILTSTGRGADIMIPMAIPAFGGMTVALITLFVVPVLYAVREEYLIKKDSK